MTGDATAVEKVSVPDKLARLLTSGFYTGKAPIASGTCGSLLALLLYFLIPLHRDITLYLIFTISLLILGALLSNRISRLLGDSDPSEIVIDEICGFYVACFMLPPEPLVVVPVFFLFRFFDIVKPFPANLLEKMPGGDGIMADDIIAGAYANIVAWLLIRYFML